MSSLAAFFKGNWLPETFIKVEPGDVMKWSSENKTIVNLVKFRAVTVSKGNCKSKPDNVTASF